jgi:hypothetical protein
MIYDIYSPWYYKIVHFKYGPPQFVLDRWEMEKGSAREGSYYHFDSY